MLAPGRTNLPGREHEGSGTGGDKNRLIATRCRSLEVINHLYGAVIFPRVILVIFDITTETQAQPATEDEECNNENKSGHDDYLRVWNSDN